MKKQNAADMEKETPNNVLNIYTAMEYNNESQSDSELNINNLHVGLNKILFLFHIFRIIVRTCCST